MPRLTAEDLVLGLCKSMGPVTVRDMLHEVRLQLGLFASETDYTTQVERVVPAINKLMREGKIELYDTGDAWV